MKTSTLTIRIVIFGVIFMMINSLAIDLTATGKTGEQLKSILCNKDTNIDFSFSPNSMLACAGGAASCTKVIFNLFRLR
jgi:hypothetical protein